jgi:hypothetical protein
MAVEGKGECDEVVPGLARPEPEGEKLDTGPAGVKHGGVLQSVPMDLQDRRSRSESDVQGPG